MWNIHYLRLWYSTSQHSWKRVYTNLFQEFYVVKNDSKLEIGRYISMYNFVIISKYSIDYTTQLGNYLLQKKQLPAWKKNFLRQMYDTRTEPEYQIIHRWITTQHPWSSDIRLLIFNGCTQMHCVTVVTVIPIHKWEGNGNICLKGSAIFQVKFNEPRLDCGRCRLERIDLFSRYLYMTIMTNGNCIDWFIHEWEIDKFRNFQIK